MSLNTFVDPRWELAARFARQVAREVLKRGLPPRVLLNVNVPNLPPDKIKGVRITRQGESAYVEDFERREDPRRQPYYWLAGSYKMNDTDQDTDAWALDAGYISVTPISYDLTAHEVLNDLSGWGLKV